MKGRVDHGFCGINREEGSYLVHTPSHGVNNMWLNVYLPVVVCCAGLGC